MHAIRSGVTSTGRPLSVGATGHRPNGLVGADEARLRAKIRDVLSALAPASGYPPLLVASLAEGADRLAASEALALGFGLIAVLPFDRREFARDFETEGSILEYQALLAHSDEVIELAGERDEAGHAAAYAAANDVILDRSEALIAIWDGAPERGPGGTATVVRRALDLPIPVVRIEAAAPHRIRVLGAVGGGHGVNRHDLAARFTALGER